MPRKAHRTEPHIEGLMKEMGTTISMARKAHGWKLGDLAKKLGMSRQTLAQAERGNPGTSISTYMHLMWFLGIKLEFEQPIVDSGYGDSESNFIDVLDTNHQNKTSIVKVKRKITLDGDF